jgi:tRNA nucleotidyltransferase (CCA-adding enzyme)
MVRVPGRSYVVGGAVRDRLLGLPVSDRDHVVVGATVAEMEAAGFKPVGRDFPVFLHPETKEEYALARTERKVRAGYTGFVFDTDPRVTLEEDLARRDLTINAMAEDDVDGHLIDPFDGTRDLRDRVFRHVGPAFAEDPVRILRLARFAARFADFSIAPDTETLIGRMVEAGEADALVPERVWQEMSRGFAERRPSRLLAVLADCGALARVAPRLADWWRQGGGALVGALDGAAAAGASVDVRFGVVAAEAGPTRAKDVAAVCEALRVPRDGRDLAVLAARFTEPILQGLAGHVEGAAALVAILTQADAFRRAQRFLNLLDVVALRISADADRTCFVSMSRAVLDAASGVDASTIARKNAYDPASVAAALQHARTEAVADALRAADKDSR